MWLCWGNGFGTYVQTRVVCGRRFLNLNMEVGEAWKKVGYTTRILFGGEIWRGSEGWRSVLSGMSETGRKSCSGTMFGRAMKIWRLDFQDCSFWVLAKMPIWIPLGNVLMVLGSGTLFGEGGCLIGRSLRNFSFF